MDSVLIEDGPVAVITLNRPEVRNALNREAITALTAAFRRLDAGPADVRVAVLRGAGEQAFCSGADLREVAAAATDVAAARAYFGALAELLETMAGVRFPIIAAVRGYALAGGCGLAAACDVTLAADDAVFGLPEVNVGLFPLVVMVPILRAAGRKRAFALMLTGERIDAAEAERIGLVTRVVPAADLDREAHRLAEGIAGRSPAAVAAGKAAYNAVADMTYDEALGCLRETIAGLALTPEARRGIAAFLDRAGEGGPAGKKAPADGI